MAPADGGGTVSARGFGPWGPGHYAGPEPSRNGFERWRVFRDPERGWIAGVCAGIAGNAGIDPAVVRIIAVVSLIFFVAPALVAYVALAVILPVRPRALFASAEQEGFWRGMRSRPQTTLERTVQQFQELERRLERMEEAVTSRDFDLHRRFRDLGG